MLASSLLGFSKITFAKWLKIAVYCTAKPAAFLLRMSMNTHVNFDKNLRTHHSEHTQEHNCIFPSSWRSKVTVVLWSACLYQSAPLCVSSWSYFILSDVQITQLTTVSEQILVSKHIMELSTSSLPLFLHISDILSLSLTWNVHVNERQWGYLEVCTNTNNHFHRFCVRWLLNCRVRVHPLGPCHSMPPVVHNCRE